jgi:predicted TIM-barrel enzyme
MRRNELRKQFKTLAPAILPVIHTLDSAQAMKNIRVAMRAGAQGVFLINHDFDYEQLLPILSEVRQAYPALWLGVNFLAVTGKDAFPVLGYLQKQGILIDAYWADDARVDERVEHQAEAEEILSVKQATGWAGLYFGGTAFKKQREVAPADYALSAGIACRFMDVVTTSGAATGEAAELDKIRTFRQACADNAIAVASGVTAENISDYALLVDAILIATGINYENDFYNIDPAKLNSVLERARRTCVPDA